MAITQINLNLANDPLVPGTLGTGETNVNWYADGERAEADVLNRPIKQVAGTINELVSAVGGLTIGNEDITLTSANPSDKDIFQYNDVTGEWENTSLDNVDVLSGLNISGVSDKDILQYNDITGKWHAVPLAESGTLSNVQLITTSDKDILQYNDITGKWENTALSSIDVLSGLNLSSLADGYILKYNSSTGKWVSTADTDNNTTYDIYAATTTNGANIVLHSSASTTDSIKLAGGGSTSVSYTDVNTINISSTDTYYQYASSWVDSGVNALLRLTKSGSSSGTQDLTIAAGSNITVTPSGTTLTIASSDQYTGTVTSVSGGDGLTGSITTSGSLSVGEGTGITVDNDSVSLTYSGSSNYIVKSGTPLAAIDTLDHFIAVSDNSNEVVKVELQDLPFTNNTGTITGVTAGNGLTGGGSSGSVTLHVGAGTGISAAADLISLNHLGIQNLADPNSDRIMFWDDSAGSMQWLSVSSGIALSGTALAHSTASGYKHIPSGGSPGQVLGWSYDGAAQWQDAAGGTEWYAQVSTPSNPGEGAMWFEPTANTLQIFDQAVGWKDIHSFNPVIVEW